MFGVSVSIFSTGSPFETMTQTLAVHPLRVGVSNKFLFSGAHEKWFDARAPHCRREGDAEDDVCMLTSKLSTPEVEVIDSFIVDARRPPTSQDPPLQASFCGNGIVVGVTEAEMFRILLTILVAPGATIAASTAATLADDPDKLHDVRIVTPPSSLSNGEHDATTSGNVEKPLIRATSTSEGVSDLAFAAAKVNAVGPVEDMSCFVLQSDPE